VAAPVNPNVRCMYRSVQFRYVHSIPAFAAAVMSGAISLGILQGILAAFASGEASKILFSAGLYVAFSFLWLPVLGLLFFPVVLLLKVVNLVNWPTFMLSGLAVGYWLSFHLPIELWTTMTAGSIGGLVAFYTIRACASSDAVST